MKNKLLFVIIAFLLLNATAIAKVVNNKNVRSIEVEFAFGLIVGEGFANENPLTGLNLLTELRTNIHNTPIDIGYQASVGFMSRDYKNTGCNMRNDGSLILFSDYNFRYWKNVSFFTGLGLGGGNYIVDYPYAEPKFSESSIKFDYIRHNYFIVVPRIGMEVWDHFRVSIEYRMLPYDGTFNNQLNFNIGVVFGGGKKK